ncbi:MAG: dihydrodipicolinate synthase family protein, partial [Candidatus Nanopelagicales bacterium]
VKLDLGTLLTLAKEGVIHGVKDSSGNDAGIRAVILGIQKLNLKEFVVLTGSELTVDSALMFGADGVIPGIGNIDPAGYVKIYDLVQKGDYADARKEQERLFEMFGLVDVGAADRMGRGSSAIGAFKAGLKLLGIIEDARTAPPAIPLNENEIAAIKPFLERAGLKLK